MAGRSNIPVTLILGLRLWLGGRSLPNISSLTILHTVTSMLAAVRVLDIGRKNRPSRPDLLALEKMQMDGVLMPQVLILRPGSTKMLH